MSGTNYPLPPVSAVTFDVGGTLIEPWPSVGHVYAAVASELGAGDFSPDVLSERFVEAWQVKDGFDYTKEAWRALVKVTFAGLVAEAQCDEMFATLYARFEQPEVWRVFEDVLPALGELRAAGFKLGIISNWDERLPRLLDGLNLTRWFDAVTVSFEAGVTKPSPLIFERASAMLGVTSGEILHVGDSAEEDLHGAQAAGFPALLLDRRAANSRALQTLAVLPRALAHTGTAGVAD